jgi:hypothetical protein
VITAIDNAHLNGQFQDPHDEDELRKAVDAIQKPLDKELQRETARAVQHLSDTLRQIVDAGRLSSAGELQQVVALLVNDVGAPPP